MNKNLTKIFFSPSGTTKTITTIFSEQFTTTSQTIDLLQKKQIKPQCFNNQDVVVIGLPVFYGRLPDICMDMLANFTGHDTPAILMVTYGNRDYEDALLELYNFMTQQGFKILGIGVFVTTHSVFTEATPKRPDKTDEYELTSFAHACLNKLKSNIWQEVPIEKVPGNYPYKKIGNIGIYPTGDTNCNNCRTCVKICPVEAINWDTPAETDREKCISCTACIHYCPQ